MMFLQPSKETDRLHSFSKTHLICQNSTNLLLVNLSVPVKSTLLVVFQLKMISHKGGFFGHHSTATLLESTCHVFTHALALLQKAEDHVLALQEFFDAVCKSVDV